MKRTIFSLVLFLTCISFAITAQRGIQLNSNAAQDGYIILHNFGDSYLIDNCGEIVKEWNFSAIYHLKLMPNGRLLYFDDKSILEAKWTGSPNVIASVSESNLELKYEVVSLKNGNYLCVGRRTFDTQYFRDRGYNLALGSPTWDDVVVEIDPVLNQIVWEWKISDHVIQERDPNIPNYGIVEDNPQLLDLDAISTFDWETNETFMINAMDYNEELDQIVLSVRKISEVIIIDHSTTTEQAAGHTLGRSGKGGDVLFRWGNPQNYKKGTAEDRVFYFQHNPNWIKYGEHKNKLIVFNNGLNRPDVTFDEQYSSIDIISPFVQADGNYAMDQNEIFLPESVDLSFTPELPDDVFYSGYMSSATVLPNGNIFCSIPIGARSLELNPNGELVWYYKGNFPCFRVEKYPTFYAGFEGRNLVPVGPIDGTENTYSCELFTSGLSDALSPIHEIKVLYGTNYISLSAKEDFKFSVLSTNGKLMNTESLFSNFHQFDKSLLNTGLYFFRIQSKAHNFKTIKVFIE